jgi:hypothetical protein
MTSRPTPPSQRPPRHALPDAPAVQPDPSVR